MKKLLTVAGVIIAALWMVKNPTGAAADVRQFLAALTTFLSQI